MTSARTLNSAEAASPDPAPDRIGQADRVREAAPFEPWRSLYAPAGSPEENSVDLQTRQLAYLRDMAEVGMSLTRDLPRQAFLPASDRISPDLALAFSRISRAVRHIMRVEQELVGLRETRRNRVEGMEAEGKRQAVRRAVRDSIRADDPDIDGIELVRVMDDRFTEYDLYEDFDYYGQSVPEIVKRACADLGIEPDLSLFPEDETDETGADETHDADMSGSTATTRIGDNQSVPRKSDPANYNGRSPVTTKTESRGRGPP